MRADKLPPPTDLATFIKQPEVYELLIRLEARLNCATQEQVKRLLLPVSLRLHPEHKTPRAHAAQIRVDLEQWAAHVGVRREVYDSVPPLVIGQAPLYKSDPTKGRLQFSECQRLAKQLEVRRAAALADQRRTVFFCSRMWHQIAERGVDFAFTLRLNEILDHHPPHTAEECLDLVLGLDPEWRVAIQIRDKCVRSWCCANLNEIYFRLPKDEPWSWMTQDGENIAHAYRVDCRDDNERTTVMLFGWDETPLQLHALCKRLGQGRVDYEIW